MITKNRSLKQTYSKLNSDTFSVTEMFSDFKGSDALNRKSGDFDPSGDLIRTAPLRSFVKFLYGALFFASAPC